MWTRRSALKLFPGAVFLATACQAQAPSTAPTPAPAVAPTTPPAPKPAAASPSSSPAAVASPSASPAVVPAASPGVVASPSPAAEAPILTGPAVSLKSSYSELIASNVPEWEALEGGFFQQHNLTVEVDFIASSTGIPALLSGDTQIAQLGGSETMSAVAGGAQLAVIGTLGAFYPFVFMAQSSISSVDQLKGKKIGVSNPGSTSDIATRVMLQKVGLNPDTDVTIVPVGSLQNRTSALISGAIDGGLAQPPDQLVLEDHGLHVVYDMAAQKLPSAGDCVVVQKSWLDANHDVAQRYIDSLIMATARAKQDKQGALQVMAKYLKTDDQRALSTTYDFFVGSVLSLYPTVAPNQFTDTVDQLSQTNPNVKNVDLSTLLDNSLVQNAMSRNVGG